MVSAGKKGCDMVCPDGYLRRIVPILSALVCDHPERCKAACCPQNTCPQGDVDPDKLGSPTPCPRRDVTSTAALLRAAAEGRPDATTAKLKEKHLKPTYPPFWLNLPYFDIYSAFMPDLLHQLHKGVFHAHLVSWCNDLMTEGQLDLRYMSMSSHPRLRQFKSGITTVKQWTGNEHKMMERVFIAAVGGGVNNDDAIKAARAVLDFIYLSELRRHTTTTLKELSDALATFHRFKYTFLPVRPSPHFNIPKIHAMQHYVESIMSYGTADGYNTESPERLHIEYAKKAYRATNKREYEKQMVVWLRRQEAIQILDDYLQWLDGPSSHPTLPAEKSNNGPEELDDTLEMDEEPMDPTGLTHRTYYHLAQEPPLRLSIDTLQDHFGAKDFRKHLSTFLQSFPRHLRLPHLYENEVFGVYKQVKLHINPSDGILEPFTDRIRATPAAVDPGPLSTLGQEPAFDTALIKSRHRRSAFPFRAARIRAIFDLPPAFASRLSHILPSSTLVYVEWFKDFQKRVNNPMRMHELEWAKDHQDRQECEILPLTEVIRSVHLAAKLDHDLQHRLTPHTVLDVHKGPFLVNDFLDLHLFFYL